MAFTLWKVFGSPESVIGCSDQIKETAERGEAVLKSSNCNLFETIAIISKNFYRYNANAQDVTGDNSCRHPWSAFRERREREVKKMLVLLLELKGYTDSGKMPPG